MLSDEEKKLRVKDVKDIPFNRAILDKNREWVMFRSNNVYRMIVLIAMIVQFLADICCLFLSFIRGIWTSWAINPLLIILACFGIFGASRVEPISLFIHAIGCYVGLLIIVIGCADNYAEYSDAVVWAMHAPGVVDLVCALLTTFMASSIVQCCCCGGCCGLHRVNRSTNENLAPANLEEGRGGAEAEADAAAATTTTTSTPGAANHRADSVVSSSSASTDDGDVEMQNAANMSEEKVVENGVNIDELDDDAKMALQAKQLK